MLKNCGGTEQFIGNLNIFWKISNKYYFVPHNILYGVEQIELVAEKAASGTWCKNGSYKLIGKGNEIELTKDGKTLFKN